MLVELRALLHDDLGTLYLQDIASSKCHPVILAAPELIGPTVAALLGKLIYAFYCYHVGSCFT